MSKAFNLSFSQDFLNNSVTSPSTSSKKPKPTLNKWTSHEDDLLAMSVQQHNEKNWQAIAAQVPGKSVQSCFHRWNKILKPKIVKGPWTEEEDQLLRDWVQQNGACKWSGCALYIPGRTGKQCRERWFNNLNPDVKKGEWSMEEDEIIFNMYIKFGSAWSKISKCLPSRSENAIKNRFYSSMRKLALDRQKAADPSLKKRMNNQEDTHLYKLLDGCAFEADGSPSQKNHHYEMGDRNAYEATTSEPIIVRGQKYVLIKKNSFDLSVNSYNNINSIQQGNLNEIQQQQQQQYPESSQLPTESFMLNPESQYTDSNENTDTFSSIFSELMSACEKGYTEVIQALESASQQLQEKHADSFLATPSNQSDKSSVESSSQNFRQEMSQARQKNSFGGIQISRRSNARSSISSNNKSSSSSSYETSKSFILSTKAILKQEYETFTLEMNQIQVNGCENIDYVYAKLDLFEATLQKTRESIESHFQGLKESEVSFEMNNSEPASTHILDQNQFMKAFLETFGSSSQEKSGGASSKCDHQLDGFDLLGDEDKFDFDDMFKFNMDDGLEQFGME